MINYIKNLNSVVSSFFARQYAALRSCVLSFSQRTAAAGPAAKSAVLSLGQLLLYVAAWVALAKVTGWLLVAAIMLMAMSLLACISGTHITTILLGVAATIVISVGIFGVSRLLTPVASRLLRSINGSVRQTMAMVVLAVALFMAAATVEAAEVPATRSEAVLDAPEATVTPVAQRAREAVVRKNRSEFKSVLLGGLESRGDRA